MKKRTWKEKIRKSCKDATTYQPYFENVIDTLAGILESRDDAEEKYIENGSKPVIEYTNKSGATNLIKNPSLAVVDDLNKTALLYWKELGLTPSAYKKVTGTSLSNDSSGGLAAALASLE
ncbi:MAG: hypothetical protein EGR89_04245 [[Eubacterium] rectale]|nr:hypothetical protein [Agathobacter rectalis]